jgi:IclR family acetate operon transcriptional repressor
VTSGSKIVNTKVNTSISDGSPFDAELVDVRGTQTVASVERASDILLHFAGSTRPDLGVTDISTDLGMSKAAVHRLLASLRSRGLISLDDRTRRYSLGPNAVMVGLRALDQLDVSRLASAELGAISLDTQETATLSVRTADSRVYVDQVTPMREVIMSVMIGVPYPLHAGASSKAFLAFLPDDEMESYLASALPKLTPATVTNRRALHRELQLIARQGWATSSGERQSGAASVAAPVLDHNGAPVAVISVCGPEGRFTPEIDRCRERLLETTHGLSRQLGFRRPR